MPACVAVVLSVLIGVFACAGQEASPGAGSLDPGCMRAFGDGLYAWDLDGLTHAWLADPGRVPELNDEVRDVLAASAGFWSNSSWARQRYPNSENRLKALTPLIERAPESVVLRLLYAEALAQANEQDNGLVLLGLLSSSSESELLPLRRLYVGVSVNAFADKESNREVSALAEQVVAESLKQILMHPPADHMHQRYLANQLSSIVTWCGPGLDITETAQLVAERADDPWLANLVCGLAHKQIAWKARGRGVAYTVTPKGNFDFKQRMSIARVSLEEAYRLRPESPEAATAMIDVCKAIAIEPEELTVWFDRVIDAQITWMPAMPEYMWAIRPRWHGSLVHMLDFARWVAAQAADNDDFADYFFTMIEFVGEDFGSHREIWYDDQLAHSARVFLTNQIAKGRNPNIATQRLLGIAWARREWAEGEKLLKGLDKPKSWAPLQHFRVHYQQAIDDILLGSAIFPGSIPTGLSLAQEERYWEAVGILNQALASPKTNQDLRDALRRVIALYKWRDRYSAGDTVELAFEDGLPGWRTWLGRARAEDGAALIGADNGNVWLSCDLDPGERYELTIDCEAPKGEGRAWSRVLIGHNWRTPDEQWHTVELRWHDAKARMRYRFDNRQSAPISGPLDDGKVHLRIVTFDGDLLVEADGQLLYRGPLAMGYTYTPGTGLFLSAWIGGQGRDAVFRNARIKPLKARPNELDGPATQLLDHDN